MNIIVFILFDFPTNQQPRRKQRDIPKGHFAQYQMRIQGQYLASIPPWSSRKSYFEAPMAAGRVIDPKGNKLIGFDS